MDELWDPLINLAAPYLTVRHNYEHTEIAFAFAKELQEILGGRKEIIFPAIIFHDVGWSAIAEELHLKAFGPNSDPGVNRVHEIEGAKIAGTLLREIKLKHVDKEEICRIIECHDSGENPITLEEKIVKDADKLFRFSLRGFSIDVKRFKQDPKEYWRFLNERRKEWFFTDPAKKIAKLQLIKVEQEFIK